MKNQIIFIHGWETFSNQRDYYDFLADYDYNPYKQKEKWHINLNKLEDFEVFRPDMPWKWNCDYIAWKIWFEKVIPYINKEKLILIGHSLWVIFLTKYLSENWCSKKINQLHLVSWVFNDKWQGQTLWNFNFDNTETISGIQDIAEKIFIYHSRDDFVVPYEHAEKYLEYLPSARLMSFEDRGHFLQAEFPELIENIKNNI